MSMTSSRISRDSESVEILLEIQETESSEEIPREEWSSLICLDKPYINPKQLLADEGLFDPGSGEICTKYIPMSDSSVFRHPYNAYPAVLDPGVNEALIEPIPKIIYFDDGQDLYLNICKEMGECPIRLFHKQLLEDKANLSYYGISPLGFRPIAMALKLNRIVKVLDLTSNFISQDGCVHLGEMLGSNKSLKELILSGCRIGPKGALRLCVNLHINQALRKLDLSKNQLGDEGVEYLSNALYYGADFTELNLSYNDLTAKSCIFLTRALEINKKLTHLDLSWNSLLSPKVFENICIILAESDVLREVNLAWTSLSPRSGNALKILLKSPTLQRLDLSYNKLRDETIRAIGSSLSNAKKLEWLNLSSNPMTPQDALVILSYLKLRKVKVMTLLLDHIGVNKEFMVLRKIIFSKTFRKGAIITHGDVRKQFLPKLADMREIVLKSAEKLCSKPKRKAVDVALLFLTIHKDFKEPIPSKDFFRAVKKAGAFQLNEDLIDEIALAFPGPRKGKIRTINLKALVDYCKRKWPDKKLPPTPPAEPVLPVEKKKTDAEGIKK